MNKEFIETKFNLDVLPWIAMQKEKIESKGRKLTNDEIEIAEIAGVENIDEIKVLFVDNIEYPFYELQNELMGEKAKKISKVNGFCFGYHILISNKAPIEVLYHELRHVAQSELFESFHHFAKIYAYELIKFGYNKGPFEIDAMCFSDEIYCMKQFIKQT